MVKTITKADLAATISAKLGLSIAACEDLINHILVHSIDIICNNKKLHLKNFGSFEFHSKKERPGRNISKQQAVTIPARNVVRFSATRKLRQKINSSATTKD